MLPVEVVIVTDPETLRARAKLIDATVTITEIRSDEVGLRPSVAGELQVIPVAFAESRVCGQPSLANVDALLDSLRHAVDGCLQDRFAALVTLPLQKSVINDAGIPFTGHTEFLAELTGIARPVMLLVAGDLRIALASTHMPLREVPDYLTSDSIREVLEVLHNDLKIRFRLDDPEIVVCGLNPHAGEGGHLGTEDDDIIAPVIRELADRGLKIRGPLPADTAFTPAAGPRDAILAMYHDQGLPVLKYAGFGHAVNVTLGLPIVRTSVDHGTALDIAGSGKADTGSVIAAIKLAAELAQI